jgi:Type I restriction modification DNA specificity domain
MSKKQFLVKKSALEKRWDPFYFQPHLVELDALVQAKTTLFLRDFVRSMAGGSTPLKSEGDQHYTNENEGVPFIRVQNLSITGNLDLTDVKHVTKSTHEGLLARSRLTGGELLVKITGVGRMAVASVVPAGLSANINQHIVAIKTNGIAQSEALAAYLNLDFVERLAARRATGGTRPALDYPALLSIPVIVNSRILDIMQRAHAEVKVFEDEAAALLLAVTNTLFQLLGIAEKKSDALAAKIFLRKHADLGDRFDALFHQIPIFDFLGANSNAQPLSSLVSSLITGFAAGKGDQDTKDGIVQIRPTNFSEDRQLVFDRNVYVPAALLDDFPADRLRRGEVLFNNTNSQDLVGKSTLFDIDGDFFCSNHITRITVDTSVLNPQFLVYVLNAYQRRQVFYRMCVNWNNQSGINVQTLRKLPVPVPTVERQAAIVEALSRIETRAFALRKNAQATLDAARQDVEKMILGH